MGVDSNENFFGGMTSFKNPYHLRHPCAHRICPQPSESQSDAVSQQPDGPSYGDRTGQPCRLL